MLQLEDPADNIKKLQNYAFEQAEKFDAAELNGRQLLDSSLKRMSPRHNETNNNLAFTSLLFFY